MMFPDVLDHLDSYEPQLTFSQLKYVRGISSSLYHLFQILITIQVQFPRNFYLQTKAVQLQPALGIVFLSSYSLGRRRATSKFWVTSCFSCFFLSLLNSIVFKMKQLNCSRNRFTRRRERFSLAEGEFPSGTNIKVGVSRSNWQTWKTFGPWMNLNSYGKWLKEFYVQNCNCRVYVPAQ